MFEKSTHRPSFRTLSNACALALVLVLGACGGQQAAEPEILARSYEPGPSGAGEYVVTLRNAGPVGEMRVKVMNQGKTWEQVVTVGEGAEREVRVAVDQPLSGRVDVEVVASGTRAQ